MSGKILKTAGKNSTKTAKTITLTATDGDINFRAKGAVKYSAKSDITYNSYKAPEQTEEKALTVKKVTGPETVEMGKTYTFKATLFSEPIKDPKVLENVKWAYQLDGEGIKEFPSPKGRIIGKTVVKKVTVNDEVWDNKKITIFAYIFDSLSEGKIELLILGKGRALLIAFPEQSATIPTKQTFYRWFEEIFGDGELICTFLFSSFLLYIQNCIFYYFYFSLISVFF